MTTAIPTTAVIIVDHGSRRTDSNQMLLDAVARFAAQSEFSIVEPAHMELAQPDIATAYARCVQRGAHHIVVFPYFLSPGRHWHEDIPALVAAAAQGFPQTSWLVSAPFGLHPGMIEIINDRIRHCLQQSGGVTTDPAFSAGCDVCGNQPACLRRSPHRALAPDGPREHD